VAEQTLLPNARPGQIFVDYGTTTPPETRRLAQRLAERDAFLVDAPVSGGANGAERGVLRTFVGGDSEAVARVRPILETIGGAEGLTCADQAARARSSRESISWRWAWARRPIWRRSPSASEPALIQRSLTRPWAATASIGAPSSGKRRGLSRTDRGARTGVKFRELPYYLRAARELGFDLPLTDALYAFCERGERVVTDDNRPAPSFWHELSAQTNQDKSDDNNH
jgi:3-hydroxyisobutyrate dehydrogenase